DDRLAGAGVADEVRADALDQLERVGYVDDSRFAAARAAALAGRGYGDAWIRHDLAEHGVGVEESAAALAGIAAEAERACEIAVRLGRTPRMAAHLGRK